MSAGQDGNAQVGRALIVGAGIGGLTAAIALRRAGIEAVVFERAGDLGAIKVGGGLHLWPNAIKALRQLGLEERARAIGTLVERSQFRTARGDLLTEIPVGERARSLGAEAVGVRRAELQTVLAEVLGQEALRLGAECTGFVQDDGGVTVTFADGRSERGDVLVGADGIASVTRGQLLGPSEPRYSGYTSYIGFAGRFDHEKVDHDVLTVSFGRGARFIHYGVGHGRMSWIANSNAPVGASDPEGGRKAFVRSTWGDWHEPIGALIEATDEKAIVHMDLCDRPPVDRWGAGRVTLLGDAAHAMVPDVAQGACQAIEDAVVLSKCLASGEHAATALRSYEDRRRARTSAIQKRARSVGKMGQWKPRLACAVRNHIILKRFAPRVMAKGDEELFAHEV